MPLYEYQCEKCGELFDVMQKFSDDPLSTHEKCGGNVQRLLSAPALQFKGSGWYITDYAKSGSSKSDGTPAQKDDPGSSDGKSSTQTPKTASETKPAS